ncbi:MAG TPA: glycogen debranching enzyme GlgX [Nitrospirae bacterium]|nr:glycogen debranching enzyme GlgX [Nitrospirota bacterium]
MYTSKGYPLPPGAHLHGGGANFALLSRHATGVCLLLFDDDTGNSSQTIDLDPVQNKTGDIWHIMVEGIKENQLYAYKVDGPFSPEEGHRFNRHKLILDPCARAITGQDSIDIEAALSYNLRSPRKDLSFSEKDNTHYMPECILINGRFDWQNDKPPGHKWSETIIYETHVRGLTIHPSSGVQLPGTYRGVTEKIPCFKRLGITALELMPVQEFLENDTLRLNPVTGERLKNYWGYNPFLFFAPHGKYSGVETPGEQVTEFKTMVRELHKAGIEVILDVVLNHTAEGSEAGPTFCFRGIDNSIYYLLEPDRRFYKNYSGCGNTLNCNHPIVRDFIIDCLRYWVVEMHIDGFRFDLASVMGRDEKGEIMKNPPILERISEDPILRDTKLIAEAWDAAGAYQVGSFPGKRWAEWNGRYRDDIRHFWRGDPGFTGALASRICGSADIYRKGGKEPLNSINFIACHDGFTLNDLVSYNHKHNEANGENNEDGTNDNYSFNYGTEGPTDNEVIERIRIRQIKNMFATLLISRGVPMLLGGDEFRRTQNGNNNAYCQDNEISWYDWRLFTKNREIYRFVREMIAFRKKHKVLSKEKFYTNEEISWFNHDGGEPDWSYSSRGFGCIIFADKEEEDICLLFNAGFVEKRFVVPPEPRVGEWHVAVDTSRDTPEDIHEAGEESAVVKDAYVLPERSLAILVLHKK